MKSLILVISLLFINIGCSQNKKDNNITKQNKSMKTKYMLNYSIPYPAEILINDMVAEIDLNQPPYPPCNLNEFLIPNDVQNIKIKIYSPNKEINSITNKLIKEVNNELAIYEYIYENEDIKEMKLIQKISFSEVNTPLPFIEQSWNINLKKKNSQCDLNDFLDLRNLDQDILLKDVINKFNELRGYLNSGDVNRFMIEISNSNQIYFESNDFNEAEKKEFKKNQFVTYSKQKNTILPIENYKLRILGNGKLISLERTDRAYLGQGVLMGIDKLNKNFFPNYIMLGISKKDNKLQVFKINSFEEGFE
ncbi:hypothetical protein GCM10023210_26970 [Chryseobacterium ginsengisoli]|uniref:Uncharacterized protein n=1 Tax=Chryseobacterium ginsengisoli TaxID=363853 RepID=A0ABP9MD58_9FLAO